MNSSPWTVLAVFFSPVTESMWGSDQLSRYDVLRYSQTAEFQLRPRVRYDFRVVWEHGRAVELRRVDICRTPRIRVTRDGLRAE